MRFAIVTIVFVALIALSRISYATIDAELAGQICNGCHGTNGVSTGYSIPSIAGLDSRYFMRTMLRFRKRERASTIMDRIAQGYKISDLRKISDYFAGLKWVNAKGDFDSNKINEGREIHDELCVECHEDNGRHQDKDIPRISGQSEKYLYMQLLDYRLGKTDMPQPAKMKEQLETLDRNDLNALSQFYSNGE